MGAESGMNSSVRDDRVALSDGAKALWGKTNRIDDSEWLPLYVHMVDSAAMASKIWDTWVPQGTKAVIVGDLGNDEVLARKLMIFMAGIHDIGKATPVFQAKSITFGPEAGSFAWKAERAGLPMIAGLRGTNHPTHPIAGEIILEGYLLRVRGWERKAARQYACVVGGHHGTPPDKSKIDEEKNRKTNVGLDSEAWVSTQDELIDFVANIAGIEEKEWEDLSERRFSVQSAVLMTGLVIMADWIASNSDEDMFPLVRTEPWADEDEDFFFSESGEEDDIQSWSGLRIRADRAWSCVQLPHAWVPEGIPSSCQDLFATRFTLPEGAKVRPVQEEAVRIARDTRQPGLMVIEAPMGEGKTEAALAAAEILAQRTGRGGVCVALPTMATTDAMFTRVRRWLEALPSCDFDNEKTVWLAHGKAQLNNDFRGIIAASHRRFSSVDQDDVKQESSQNRKKKQIDVPPETVVSDWLWGRKKGALANFLVCTVDQVLMSALQMKHVVLRQLAMANKVVIIDECHAYDAYMQEYLKMALEWLGGYRTPVILLSATLPECQRNAMVEAYLKGWCDTEPRKASKVSILEQLRARNASNTHHINHTANSEMSCEKGTAEKLRLISNAYPLLTYTDGHETKHADVKPSGRSMKVQCRLVDDDDTALLDLMDALLVDGGCIGVICDTVGRAQHAAELLGNHCGRDCVRLTHSRFMDIFEHCTIGRDDNAITVTDVTGVIHVPAAALSVLMLGPGARVTHQAMTVIGENGATVIWVGERGVRMYAFGKPLTHSSALLQKQAELVSNTRKRLSVARMMYQMRFPGEDVSGLTMQQLRGREGARIRRVYRECSERTGVEWDKRTYDHDDFDAGSEINKALSAANTCLYGLAHAAIVALGCSPGLGFVHVGHERSFVYDIADLYKAELSIPVAFETVAAKPEDIGSAVRHNIRDAIYDLSLMKRMTKDIRYLLGTSELEDDVFESDHVGLWDDKQGEVSAGKSYSDNDEWDGGTW